MGSMQDHMQRATRRYVDITAGDPQNIVEIPRRLEGLLGDAVDEYIFTKLQELAEYHTSDDLARYIRRMQ